MIMGSPVRVQAYGDQIMNGDWLKFSFTVVPVFFSPAKSDTVDRFCNWEKSHIGAFLWGRLSGNL